MNYRVKYIILSAFIWIAVLSGCNKPGPIELVDSTTSTNPVQIDTSTSSSGTIVTSPDVDSSGMFSSVQSKAMGQILVAGARFDGIVEHHSASIAQLAFFNASAPIAPRHDTVAYLLQPVGDVRINGLLMARHLRRFQLSPILDTTLGVEYILFSRDSIGGRGFQYAGNTTFQVTSEGTLLIPAFSESTVSVPVFSVIAPVAGTEIDPRKNIHFRLDSTAGEVTIFIRPMSSPNGAVNEKKPLLKLKSKRQGSGFTIPSSVLRMLPDQHRDYIFSFCVENNRIIQIPGYRNDVLFTTSYTHHIVLRIKR